MVGTIFLPDDIGGRIANIITIITAIIGAVALFVQFKKDKELNKANFMLEYNKTFYNDYNLTDLFNVLDNYESSPEKSFDYDKYQGDVARYLQWLESIASLIERGVIDFYMMDNVLAYRFFIFVNNPIIQEKELIPYYKYERGIFYLYEKWHKYEEMREISIPLTETALHKHEKYDEIIQEVMKTSKKA